MYFDLVVVARRTRYQHRLFYDDAEGSGGSPPRRADIHQR